jgi:hypothetical protein
MGRPSRRSRASASLAGSINSKFILPLDCEGRWQPQADGGVSRGLRTPSTAFGGPPPPEIWGRMLLRDFLDRLIDQLRIGRGAMTLGDQPSCGLRCGIRCGRAELLNGGALL